MQNAINIENIIKIEPNKSFKIAMFAALGSGLEYYDFVIYGMMAKYLGDIFFPSHMQFSGVMQAFAIFAIGYFIRPFAGTFFGMIADTYGRKKAFLIIILTMACSTLGIGLLPTYSQVGIISPILLIICRLLQGISIGGELAGATTIVSESSSKESLGKYVSLILSSTTIGALFSTMVLMILTKFFSYEEIIKWAWRIPFLIGGTLAIIIYYIRRNIEETPEFIQFQNKKNSNLLATFLELFSKNILNLLIGFGLTFFLATIVIINLYFPVYINKYFNYNLGDIYSSITTGLIACSCFMLIFGWLSDRISKIKLVLFALIGFSISVFPLYLLLKQEKLWSLHIFFIVYQLWNSIFFTSYLPILSRLFTTNVRCSGTALTYNLAFSIASLIPTICTYSFAKSESPFFLGIFFIIAICSALISIIALIFRNKRQYAY